MYRIGKSSLAFNDEALNFTGRTVAVTGASGFIGKALVRALAQSGARVRAIQRRRGPQAVEGVDTVIVRSGNQPSLIKAFTGCDFVFHFAYDVRAGADPNLALFDAIHGAAQASGVRRIIHASSVAVYDHWPGDGRLEESAPCNAPAKTAYAAAKREMERRLLEQDRLEAAILQPTIVYGPGSTLWTEATLKTMTEGGVVLPNPPGICPTVHVEDVVQAALRAACTPDLGQDRFLISGRDQITWYDFFEAHRQIVGTGEIRLVDRDTLQSEIGEPQTSQTSSPGLAARLSSSARQILGHDRVDRLAAALRRTNQPQGPKRPSPSQLALYRASPKIVCDHAQNRLNYRPRVGFSDGMAEIAARTS